MQSKFSKKTIDQVFEWDVQTWSKVVPFWEEHCDIKPGLKVLTVGERGGGLSLFFALKGCHVTCTDFREFPSSIYELHRKYDVQNKIEYVEGVDVSKLDCFADETFDLVVFKSVLGALSEQNKQKNAFDEMHRVLKKHGFVLFAENLKASKLHQAFRQKYVKWNDYWRYFDLKNDDYFYAKFTKKQFKTQGFIAVFGRTEQQRGLLAKIDRIILRAIPKSWRYVLFGVLSK
ncbi:class I SAM-dependent methyltransferase [Crocinitomix algicola]|uniref:class I SAM-dependent methyltransferase n=1 Tax=Crocinitomix algicola TaxID=1740263 RepID=UPI000872D155|nr:class I SAM-dependent methyltransferase [Crocinitomix algicola]